MNIATTPFLFVFLSLYLLFKDLLLVLSFWLFIISCRLLVLLIFSDQILHAVEQDESESVKVALVASARKVHLLALGFSEFHLYMINKA